MKRIKRRKRNPIALKNFGVMTKGQLNGLLKTFQTGTIVTRGEMMITASFKGEKLLSAAKVGPGLYHVRAPVGMIERKNPEIHIDIHSHNTKGGGNVRAKNPGARFTVSQLARLRDAYAKLEGVDPSKPAYRKLSPYLSGLTQPQLKQLAGAKIKFLSALARNRVQK
jgi:hypothetical protein